MNKNYKAVSRRSLWFTNHVYVITCFTDHAKVKNRIHADVKLDLYKEESRITEKQNSQASQETKKPRSRVTEKV